MNGILNATIFFFICLFLLNSTLIEIKESTYKIEKNEKVYEDKIINEDTKVIKTFLIKALETQIKEENFINKHFIKKTLKQISRQLAIYYNQIINFNDDPDRSIKMINDIINNSQAYIEAGSIYLMQKKSELQKKYNYFEEKYCDNYFQKFFNPEKWKEKASLKEFEAINQLEDDLKQIDNVLKVFNRIKILFSMIDWTIYSNSPFAMITRKCLGL